MSERFPQAVPLGHHIPASERDCADWPDCPHSGWKAEPPRPFEHPADDVPPDYGFIQTDGSIFPEPPGKPVQLARQPVAATCEWSEDEDSSAWATSCGKEFTFTEDGPKENGTVFCCYCGKRLVSSPRCFVPEGS
jgi:hypothetical protein